MNRTLKDIIDNKKVCYFISPHYDDMIFSAGALASELAKTNKIVVINIFTSAGTRNTLSAKAYLKQCGYTDATKLYIDRAVEDKTAIKPITKQIIDLGFREALWRRKSTVMSHILGNILPELGSIYPTYRFNIIKGRIAKSDTVAIADIEARLKELVKIDNSAIFCPLGIGNHIDHVITEQVCTRLFKNPIYWADYPYNQQNTTGKIPRKHFAFANNMEEKAKQIAEYKTQYEAMFGKSGPVLVPEQFYTT
jgi:LmbE family N-acetylglucosaminyl deacetylase